MSAHVRTEHKPLVLPAMLQPMPITSLHHMVAEVQCRRALGALMDRYEMAARAMRAERRERSK